VPKIESLEMVVVAIENYTANVCGHFVVGLPSKKVETLEKHHNLTRDQIAQRNCALNQ